MDGDIVLTPRNVNPNVAGVFRPSTDSAVAPLLPGSVIDSDDDEDDALLYHDGCTVIHQTSTFGDHTVNTMASLQETPHERDETTPDDASMPALSPDGLPLSRMAAQNGSFLFSPDNMGRAIVGKERRVVKSAAAKKDQPSITMLPAAAAAAHRPTQQPEGRRALAVKRSYSHESTYAAQRRDPPAHVDAADDPSVHSLRGALVPAETVQEDAEGLEESSQKRGSPDHDLINNDGIDGVSSPPEDAVVARKEDQTPLVSNIAPTKKKSPVTACPEANIDVKTAAEGKPSPLLVALSSPLSTSLSTSSFKIAKEASPSAASLSSFKSAKGGSKKKPSPKSALKAVPKSACKARKGFVKDRVSHIQHRIEEVHSNGAVNGRLKRNHSYRYKNSRRVTKGEGVLAPRKAVLQTTYIRSVPICIAKTRSSLGNSFEQGESWSVGGNTQEENDSDIQENEGYSISGNTQEESRSDTKEDTHEEDVSYASKYTGTTSVATKPTGLLDNTSVGNADKGSRFSDASSDVSETTESDPFNSLLGKMLSEDEPSSSSEEEEGSFVGKQESEEVEKCTDVGAANNVTGHLPFKPSLVKPTELRLHPPQQQHHEPPRPHQHHLMSPLSAYAPTSKPNKWRELASAAAGGKEGGIVHTSARFRSEKSVRNLFENKPR